MSQLRWVQMDGTLNQAIELTPNQRKFVETPGFQLKLEYLKQMIQAQTNLSSLPSLFAVRAARRINELNLAIHRAANNIEENNLASPACR